MTSPITTPHPMRLLDRTRWAMQRTTTESKRRLIPLRIKRAGEAQSEAWSVERGAGKAERRVCGPQSSEDHSVERAQHSQAAGVNGCQGTVT
jgi:hypothetical protein